MPPQPVLVTPGLQPVPSKRLQAVKPCTRKPRCLTMCADTHMQQTQTPIMYRVCIDGGIYALNQIECDEK